jgi:uncharacterized damage-inducible protein DinB
MDVIEHLNRLFDYNDWANRETLASLKAAGSVPERSLKFMAHIIGAEWLWLGRVEQEKQVPVVWPELTLEGCEEQLGELERRWQEYLVGLTPDDLSQPIHYINSKGESWTNSVEDILLHVIMHSTYHRGQIASDMRASGHTPAYTDFIHSVRQGFVE